MGKELTRLLHGAILEVEPLEGYIFGLNMQLIVDAIITALAVGFLFFFMSYLLFNPARNLLKKRQDKIKEEMETTAKNKAEAIAFKAEYDEKLKNAEKEVDGILSEGRKKALKRENEIVDEAKAEAVRILERADREIELEKSKMKDEVKKEMVAVASVMAGKIIAASIDTDKQAQLIDEALNEMGDNTWRS